jgi:hypothetical protein
MSNAISAQLLAYLDTAISELEAGQWEGVAGALLYPPSRQRAEPGAHPGGSR